MPSAGASHVHHVLPYGVHLRVIRPLPRVPQHERVQGDVRSVPVGWGMKRHGNMIVTDYGGIRFNAPDYADATPEDFHADFAPAWADAISMSGPTPSIGIDISFHRGIFYLRRSRAKAISARARMWRKTK